MICKYYGLDITFFEMESYCPLSKNGTSLLALSDAAQKIGFTTISGKYALEYLRKVPVPCILHWNQNHFVVLYKVKKDTFYIADPAKGLIKYNVKEFKKHWIYPSNSPTKSIELGIALVLSLNKDFEAHCNPNKFDSKVLRAKIAKYFLKFRQYFTIISIGLGLNSILQLLLPFLTQAIVDKGIHEHSIRIIWLILIGELMIVIGKTISEFIQSWIVVHISTRIHISMIYDFFKKLLKLPMSFFDTRLLGDLMQRMGDYSRIQSFIGGELLGIVISCFSFIILSFVLFLYNLQIFMCFCGGSLLYSLWIALFLSKRKELDYEFFEKQGSNNNVVYQLLSNMQEIKLQSCEKRRVDEWIKVQLSLFKSQVKLLATQQVQDSGSLMINEVKNILITIIAATAVIKGDMSLGEMLAIQYIVGQLQSPVSRLIRLINSIQDVKISFDRINEIDSVEEENHSRPLTINEKASNFTFQINHLSFKYQPSSPKLILNDITFNIPNGRMTAIVGHSGCGKSTLIKLLLGYYRVPHESILINNIDINQLNTEWLRHQCGVILQEGTIFSESIAQNIAIQTEKYYMEDVIRAAKIAEIYDFIMSLPMGFYTKIGRDGLGLSHGQKQRILIARAIYKSPSVIIMDEATNSLDSTTEKNIVSNLHTFLKNKTSIIIAHRLSTIINADQIIVMNAGKVVEIGDHKTLLENRGCYYQLVKNQLYA